MDSLTCPFCSMTIVPLRKGGMPIEHKINGQRQQNDMLTVFEFWQCPSCKKLLVSGREEHYHNNQQRSNNLLISDWGEEKILHPATRQLVVDERVPEEYATEAKESASVLPLSPNASALLSRRLLQRILREKFEVKHSNLYNEIEEFLKKIHRQPC